MEELKYYDIVESGKRIRNLRQSKGFTQEVFAERVGLSYRSIADIERGYRGTSIDVLVIMREVLDTTLDYLILGFDSRIQENGCSEEEILILSLLAGKSKKHKILAEKILKGILDSVADELIN